MNAIHMIQDYKTLCEEATQIGKFEAYKNYTEKYPNFFNGVFHYLYCQPLETLRPMIEAVDFGKLLEVSEENYRSGIVEYTIASVKTFVERMGVDFEFSLLLGLELSNIGGCALPNPAGIPHLYIGTDKPLQKAWIDLFVPHEMFHMVRHHVTRDNDPETVFSRTIEEGLASYASMWVHDLQWNAANVAKALGISEKQARNLMSHSDALLDQLIADGNAPISAETMKAYFTAERSDAQFPVIGYYVGTYLAHLSTEKGVEFAQFVSMPRNDIIRMWFHTEKL